jgi:hypothetical protein
MRVPPSPLIGSDEPIPPEMASFDDVPVGFLCFLNKRLKKKRASDDIADITINLEKFQHEKCWGRSTIYEVGL